MPLAMSIDRRAVLADAVARGMPVVVVLPVPGIAVSQRSRFLLGDPQGIWVEDVAEGHDLLERLYRDGHAVTVTFQVGHERLSFSAPILQVEPALVVNDSTTLPAVMLALPNEVLGAERRQSYRVRVAADDAVRMDVWRIGDKARLTDQPPTGTQLPVILRNLSAGGAGVVLPPPAPGTFGAVSGQRLRVMLGFGQEEVLLEGRLRREAAAGAPSDPPMRGAPTAAGIHFDKLESDLLGRQAAGVLARVVGDLQRRELNRMRAAVA